MSPEELQEERDAIDASLNRTTTPETCLAQKWGVTQEVIGKGAFGKIRIIRREVQQPSSPSSSSSAGGDGDQQQQLFAVKVEKNVTEWQSNMVNVMIHLYIYKRNFDAKDLKRLKAMSGGWCPSMIFHPHYNTATLWQRLIYFH